MTVKQKPATYTASDGSEWATTKEAERQDSLVVAARELDEAKKNFCRAVLKSSKTADGQPFDLSSCRDYWFVPWFGMDLVRVDAWFYNQEFSIDNRGRVGIVKWEESRKSQVTYHAEDLFSTEQAARVELIKRMKQQLQEQAKRIEQIESRMR